MNNHRPNMQNPGSQNQSQPQTSSADKRSHQRPRQKNAGQRNESDEMSSKPSEKQDESCGCDSPGMTNKEKH